MANNTTPDELLDGPCHFISDQIKVSDHDRKEALENVIILLRAERDDLGDHPDAHDLLYHRFIRLMQSI